MVMVFHSVLVANYLTVQFVNQFVDSGVQVFMGTFGKHVAAFDVDIAFGTLPPLLFLLLLNGK